ncbi:hypothetical protein DLAC_11597 [Tieghemostelium lacteum]|uniref:N-acetyltransferase domain-containing protein n=1 Tax=Tieghemostelium lacteum TaxID=361077 RepID=A0A151ZKC6_TIELA|nr:hypothetical protein DLAC_11597 [Tieghemostelium lacteum]|eukprot:KYQ94387.1 hypothetical protein DLAC_11597 [Tieghemostelium lacteum]
MNTATFCKNLIPLDIQTLELKDFINNHFILQEIKDIIAPSYEDPSSMLKRDLSHSNKLYIARERDGRLITFLMVGWENVLFKGQNIPTVYIGLSATRQDQKNTGIVRYLYKRFLGDAQAWEQVHQQRLLLWYTTATPSAFHVSNLMEESQPNIDGSYTEEGKKLILALRDHKKWPAFIEGHPFIVKGIAEKTRYSVLERERIKKIEEGKNFTLFTELGIDETQGDRMVCIGRVPSKVPSSKL